MSRGLPALDPCVHCGFCLQACPTFVQTGDEADSPRGRIVLMQQLASGTLALDTPAAAYHLDRCLGCRACETACPSGVEYGHALEHVRARMLHDNPTPPEAKAVLTVMAERRLGRVLMSLARMVRPILRWFAGRSRLGFGFASVAATKGRVPALAPVTGFTPPPHAKSRGTAVVFRGCIMDGLFRHVNRATIRTLAVNGYRVIEVPAQGCCGALHAHAGERDAARELARANIRAFRSCGDAVIAINSAGCGSTLKDYGHLLADDPMAEEAAAFGARVRDVTELLADAGPLPGAPVPLRVAYDAPCHLHHAQRVESAPLDVLHAIPDLEVVPHAEREACCGSAGLYSLVQREMSLDVLDRKLRNITDAEPDVVATGNPGCAMHIGAGLLANGEGVSVMHPVELLDLSYRRAGMVPPG